MVRQVYENTGTLKRSLCRSALKPPTCFQEPDPGAQQRRGRPKGPCIVCKSGGKEGCCGKKNTVYMLECRECHGQYIGETGRPFEIRAKEHNMQARNKQPRSPWGQHYATHHPTTRLRLGESAFSKAEVIAQDADTARRKLREAVEIKHRKPTIDISGGWELL